MAMPSRPLTAAINRQAHVLSQQLYLEIRELLSQVAFDSLNSGRSNTIDDAISVVNEVTLAHVKEQLVGMGEHV